MKNKHPRAQNKITGCAGRNDVFYGTLKLITNNITTTSNNTVVHPYNFKKNLNNYRVGDSDTIGKTIRTIKLNLQSTVNNAKFYLITSSHGANQGGEEYNRRWHYINFDGSEVMSY